MRFLAGSVEQAPDSCHSWPSTSIPSTRTKCRVGNGKLLRGLDKNARRWPWWCGGGTALFHFVSYCPSRNCFFCFCAAFSPAAAVAAVLVPLLLSKSRQLRVRPVEWSILSFASCVMIKRVQKNDHILQTEPPRSRLTFFKAIPRPLVGVLSPGVSTYYGIGNHRNHTRVSLNILWKNTEELCPGFTYLIFVTIPDNK